jgi:hypothetical protein
VAPDQASSGPVPSWPPGTPTVGGNAFGHRSRGRSALDTSWHREHCVSMAQRRVPHTSRSRRSTARRSALLASRRAVPGCAAPALRNTTLPADATTTTSFRQARTPRDHTAACRPALPDGSPLYAPRARGARPVHTAAPVRPLAGMAQLGRPGGARCAFAGRADQVRTIVGSTPTVCRPLPHPRLRPVRRLRPAREAGKTNGQCQSREMGGSPHPS